MNEADHMRSADCILRPENQAITNLKQSETSPSMMTKPVKLEEDVEFKSNLLCSTNNLNSGSKSKQHFTENEKEARRLRRVLANRESARQTIRRRQAMFEELNRKAVDLELENDNLKKDKEVAKKEYESLKSTNNCLKAQVTEILKPEAETEVKSEPRNSETSTSEHTTALSFPYDNLASTLPFYWPIMVQPPEASVEQCRSESGTATPPLVPMMQLWKPNSFLDQGNSVVIAKPGTLLCVLPFPCFFPFQGPGTGTAGHPQSSGLDEKQKETSSSHQYTARASPKQKLNCESCLSLKASTEALDSGGSKFAGGPHQAGFSLPTDGNGEAESVHQQEMLLKPAPLNCIRPVASIGPVTALHQNDNPNGVLIPCTNEDTSETISDEPQEETIQPGKKSSDVVAAAAEARKRRKELMKLKTPHGNQY